LGVLPAYYLRYHTYYYLQGWTKITIEVIGSLFAVYALLIKLDGTANEKVFQFFFVVGSSMLLFTYFF